MAFKTITAKYSGTCRRCGNGIQAGSKIRFGGRGLTYHLSAQCGEQVAESAPLFQAVGLFDGDRVDSRPGTPLSNALAHDRRVADRVSIARNFRGEVIGMRNARGRCEDAPCCGCCS